MWVDGTTRVFCPPPSIAPAANAHCTPISNFVIAGLTAGRAHAPPLSAHHVSSSICKPAAHRPPLLFGTMRRILSSILLVCVLAQLMAVRGEEVRRGSPIFQQPPVPQPPTIAQRSHPSGARRNSNLYHCVRFRVSLRSFPTPACIRPPAPSTLQVRLHHQSVAAAAESMQPAGPGSLS